ncbi:MAG: hypothetical protein LBI18_06125 [Planctomycetaceae bacterium]|jgi:hypothetical protein|nr:hypothetical protein [Planctomycetaceae bacterium]
MKHRANKSPVSLFSFQDIIMSVVGIVILITLLLILKLITQMSLAESVPTSAISVRELTELINSLKTSLREIQDETSAMYKNKQESQNWIPTQDQLDALQTTIERLEIDIAEIRPSIENATQHAEKLKHNQSLLSTEAEEQQIKQLKELTEQLEEQHKELARQQKNLQLNENKLKNKNTELDQQILKTDDKSMKVTFSNHAPVPNHYLYLTLFDTKGFTVFSSRKSEEKNFRETNKFCDFILSEQKQFRQRNEFLNGVFLVVRPSKMDEYEEVIKLLQNKGIQVGFTYIGENTEFSLENQ